MNDSLPIITLPQEIHDLSRNCYFRQSFLNDYLLCPQMAMYRWILQIENQAPFFAAVLGTAGHAVIEYVHKNKDFTMSNESLQSLFTDYAHEELKTLPELPNVSVKFSTHAEQIKRLAPEYTALLREYCDDRRNQQFTPTICETSFVLELPALKPSEPPYLFTGTIDQAGFYMDGTFAIRDIKFRDSAFRPDGIKLDLNKQLTLYTAATRWGLPVCGGCKPRYDNEGEFSFDDISVATNNMNFDEHVQRKVIYSGPCKNCKAKIGTDFWPQILPVRSELVWMRDYKKHQRDQHARTIKSPVGNDKVINPKTGRKKQREIINPKWLEGYKKNSHCGPAILSGRRDLNSLGAFLAEMQQICESIRSGKFYRREGDHCTNWCRHRDACVGRIELDREARQTFLERDTSSGHSATDAGGSPFSDAEAEQFMQDFFS